MHSRREQVVPVQLRVIASTGQAPLVSQISPVSEPARPGQALTSLPRQVRAAATPAAVTVGQGAEVGSGFDVPPVPERGWNINLRSFSPWAGVGKAKVVIGVEVSAQGDIQRWRLLQSTLSDDMAMATLHGIEATAMLPAIRAGESVDAVARYELSFGPP